MSGLFAEPVPAWAPALADPHVAPALVARAVRLAASGWADAARIQRAVAQLLETGREPGVEAVLDAVERLVPRGRRLADDAARDAAGAALVGVGARALLVTRPGYPASLADAWPELGAPPWLFVRRAGAAAGSACSGIDAGAAGAAADARAGAARAGAARPAACADPPRADPLPAGPAVAVVGTRHPSLDGLATARELARRLARAGVTVVSGMARGIDQAAHRGALDANGRTVAVLGTGLDVDYPKGDAALRAEVAEAGGLVTEHACGAPPRPAHFLARNRIIAGLADLTVVVEGRERSGALQTARLAAAQGRDVWAVPGSVNAPTSRGPLALVRDGANVVTRLDDVLEAVHALRSRDADGTSGMAAPDGTPADGPRPDGPRPDGPRPDGPRPDGPPADARRNGAPPGLGPDAAALLGLLSAVPASPNALAGASGLPLPAVLAAASELTARGLARQTPRGLTARHRPTHQRGAAG